MPLLGLAAWAGGLAGLLWPNGLVVGVALVGGPLVVARRRPGAGRTRVVAAALLVFVAVGSVAQLRHEQVGHGPVAVLAEQRAVVHVVGTVSSDSRVLEGRFGQRIMLRLQVRQVTAAGATYRLSAPVLVLGDEGWRDVPLGTTVMASGRLDAADGSMGGDLAAVLLGGSAPEVTKHPGIWWRGADAVRSSLRSSVDHRPPEQRALVPALVDGDDGRLEEDLADDFRATGLTHLLTVSGTNLTLVVGFLLLLARWIGVRGRWLHLVGALGIAGFVLLARTEPSVLRAAVMGSVALVGLSANGQQRGTRALGVAVVVLLLTAPGLAVSVGFALSVLATAGILLLAPVWRDALADWLPRWVAEAVAVPAAAQVACTPLVAGISGQVSLVAVLANLLVAPVVGPATVLGLAGGLLGLVSEPVGRSAGTLAGWCVAWLVAVARHGAALPTAALDWGTGLLSLGALTLLTLLLALALPHLLRSRGLCLGLTALLTVLVLAGPTDPRWPPDGWVIAACDVGQGDALVLRSGPGAAVVVDAGPDPESVDRCLDRLGVTTVPLVVLTHFHADHVDGLAGVGDGRRVGAIETTTLADPPQGVASVAAVGSEIGTAPSPAPYGVTRQVGEVSLQVLWPAADHPTEGPGDGSTANAASVVLVAEVRGVRLLLSGDLEPEGQAELARTYPGLQVDVLKVPHHGSRYQDLDFLLSLGARVGLVSVGSDNGYGHPAAETVEPLAASGATVLRTDRDGDVVVVERDGVLSTVTRG